MFAPEIVCRMACCLQPESDKKGRSLSQCALHGDRAAHLGHKLTADSNSDTCALHAGYIVETSIIIKESLLQLAAHPHAVVTDFKGNLSEISIAVALSADHSEGYLSAFMRVLHCIVEKVHQYFCDPDLIADKNIVLDPCCADLKALVLELRLHAHHV